VHPGQLGSGVSHIPLGHWEGRDATATHWAWEQHLIGRDVLSGYKRPKIAPSGRASSSWTAEEAGKFLAAVAYDRLRACWWLLLTRGMRRGELLGLRWEDIDLDARRLRIVRTRVVVDGQVVESAPKTASSRRLMPLDAALVAELRAHRRRQLEERLRAGEAWGDSGFVFTDELGRPVRPDTLSGRFDALIAKAGVRRIKLHDGRHSAATMLLEDGTST
jgi:integrase